MALFIFEPDLDGGGEVLPILPILELQLTGKWTQKPINVHM